jgi:hypothetical protein
MSTPDPLRLEKTTQKGGIRMKDNRFTAWLDITDQTVSPSQHGMVSHAAWLQAERDFQLSKNNPVTIVTNAHNPNEQALFRIVPVTDPMEAQLAAAQAVLKALRENKAIEDRNIPKIAL